MSKQNKQSLSTRSIAMAGMLGAIAVVLGATGLGMIPIPSIAGRATIMHIPVILAGVLEGPVVGALTGLIFGLYSFLTPTGAIPADPIVRILPRILIGVVSYYTFVLFRRNRKWGAMMAGIMGTLTNTVGFIGLAILFGYFPPAIAVTILPQAIVELVLAAFLTVVLVKALYKKY